MGKLTVIVPAYNSEHTVERCINSITSQDYEDLEIILINDGSKDNTHLICQRIAINDNRIIYINKENEGVSKARNDGLDAMTGDFVTFVDSDDIILPNMYSTMLELQEKYSADIVECGISTIISNGEEIKTEFNPIVDFNNVEYSISAIEQENTTASSCNKIFKARLFEKLRYPQLAYSEDYYVNVVLALKINNKQNATDIFYHYLQNDSGAKKSVFTESKLDDIKARELLIDKIKSTSEEPNLILPYLYRNILDRIIRLYAEMKKASLSDEKYFKEYFESKVKKYYPLVANKFLKDKMSAKVFYLIYLFYYSPFLFDKVYDSYLFMSSVRKKKLANIRG